LGYKFLDGIAIADVAFEARGRSLEELFKSCGEAIAKVMVKDPSHIEPRIAKRIKIKAQSAEYLLFDFMNKIVFYKDAQRLLFGKFDMHIAQNDGWNLECTAYGDHIGRKYALDTDVKGVSMYMFELKKEQGTWIATVVLDV
jgi:SHS2 domain-containing protein